MAADIYLQIEGIKGESRDSQHQGWMECQHVDWGVHQPATPGLSASGRTVGRCHYDTLVLARLCDIATPVLLQMCCAGRTLPKARVECWRADGDGHRVKYFEIELDNVLVAEVHPGVAESQSMEELIALAYSKIKWRYNMQKVGGGTSGSTIGGWDLASNCRA